jgi:hypothetical protein
MYAMRRFTQFAPTVHYGRRADQNLGNGAVNNRERFGGRRNGLSTRRNRDLHPLLTALRALLFHTRSENACVSSSRILHCAINAVRAR